MEKFYYCSECRGKRKHEMLFEKNTRGSHDDYFHWVENYSIIECLGCENISFLKIYSDSEMQAYDNNGNPEYSNVITIYPSYLEEAKELNNLYYLPQKIRSIYKETITALNNELFILAAGGLRAIIEAICNQLKIRKEDLSVRIDLLHKKGHLTVNESRRLHSIRFLGNDALHEIETPKKESILVLLDIVNHLLENLFIQDKKIGNTVDMVIDTYEDFLKAIVNNISDTSVDNEFTINELLGRSRRLIQGKIMADFVDKLQKGIIDNQLDYIAIGTKDPLKYIILKKPYYSFEEF